MAVDYEKDGRIAIFTINRPEALNALDMEAIHQLHKAMVDFRDDPELWVGIITGVGQKAFCAGADVKDAVPFIKKHLDAHWVFPPAIWRGMELWKPLIAAINGVALGGGLEIALSCDIRVASENVRLGTPEATIGVIPGWGGTQRLPRMIPWCKAAEILLAGKIIDAQEAYRIGLVNEVVPQSDLIAAAKKWAGGFCQTAPLAVRAIKEAMVRGYSMTLGEGLRLEQSLLAYIMGTEDFEEGNRAFVEKRKPTFKSK
ncbi:enoyl-CoA hydratase/isomerase family protein [Chloroflexota bacterium]